MFKQHLKAGIVPACFFLATFSNSHAEEQSLPVSIFATQNLGGVPVAQLGSSISIVTAEQIERSGAVTVADALRLIPSLSVNQAGGPGSLTQLRVRGGEANHLLLLVDGIRFNDPSGFGFDYSGMLAGEVERIEVIRGPQSGIYGSDAHAGVVAITTKSGKGLKKTIAQGHAEAGSFGSVAGNVFAATGNGNAWASIAASAMRTDGYNTSTAGTEKDGANIASLTLRFGATVADTVTVDGTVRGGYRDADFDDGNFFDPLSPPLLDTALPHYQLGDLAGRLAATIQTPGSSWQQHLAWNGYQFSRKSIDAFGPFNSEGHRNEILYRLKKTFETPEFANAKHELSVQASREWLDYTTSFQPKASLGTSGFAAEWRLSLFDALHLGAAIRHDVSEFFEDPTTYRLTARYNLKDFGISLHSAVGTGITNPTLDELFGSSGGFVGNPALLPEESFEWEAGIEKTWGNGEITTGVTYFEGHTKNEIRTLFFPVYTAVNQPGESPRRGVETTLTYAPFSNFFLTASYTYTDARTATGLQEIRRPPHAGALNATLNLLDDKLKLNFGIAFNGTMLDQDFRDFPAPFVRLPSYTLLNASVTYALNEQTEIYARVQNGLDQDYQETFGYRAQPFSAFAGVKIKFGDY